LHQFELPLTALYRVHGPVNLVRFNQLIDLVDNPKWLFPRYNASFPQQMVTNESIFERLKSGDVMIHQPYESFDGVLSFLVIFRIVSIQHHLNGIMHGDIPFL
jgi:polyphosphate kinase